MFKRLYVDNYKCLVNFELPLQELTLLLGADGAGKTSVLDVMFAVRQLLNGTAKITDSGIFSNRTLTVWQSRKQQVFELEAQLKEEQFTYRLEVEHEEVGKRARITLESLTANQQPLFRFERGDVRLFRDDHSEGPTFSSDQSESALARVAPRPENTRLTRFLNFATKVIVCGLYPASFETEAAEEASLLHRDARNFAAWFWHMQLERPDRVTDFTKALHNVIDGFQGLRLEKAGLDTRALMVRFAEEERRYEFRLDEISDGQRALIALYALVLLAADQGYTLFLDEPENYVALTEIQPWLVELADSCGDSVPQAVLCSHHLELIDYLGGKHGLLLRRETTGVTRAESLTTMPTEGGLKLSEIIARGWER